MAKPRVIRSTSDEEGKLHLDIDQLPPGVAVQVVILPEEEPIPLDEVFRRWRALSAQIAAERIGPPLTMDEIQAEIDAHRRGE